MRPEPFHLDVVGLMSGTSLDGLDICLVSFDFDGSWHYRIVKAESVDYPAELREKLASAQQMTALDYARLHSDYGLYLGGQVRDFLARNALLANGNPVSEALRAAMERLKDKHDKEEQHA